MKIKDISKLFFFSMGLYFKGSHASPYKATNNDDY